jgi:Flp pilus assembly pilin Flp
MDQLRSTPLAVWLRHIVRDHIILNEDGDRGAGLVEYSLLLALIAILCVGAMRFLGGQVDSGLSNNTSTMFGP